MAYCETFADWAAVADLPEAARGEARLALLDTFGCMITGWDESQTRAAREAFAAEGTATAKALILGTAAHALDFDDYEAPGSTHPSAPIFGAVLGLTSGAERRLGDILDAYVIGFEAIVRLGEWMRYDHYNAGWHATGTLGTIGATAASARLLRLGAQEFTHALAISASLAGGLKAQFGTDAKALHAGLAARAGIEAACLAGAGATGSAAVFEGRYGFADIHHGVAKEAEGVLAKIGAPVAITEHAILRKPWPSCAYTHRVIDAALALRPRLPSPKDWARITIRMPEPFFRVSGFFTPVSANEARFSATYCTLAAMLDGIVGPQSFRAEAFLRPEIARLLAQTEVDAYDPGPALVDMSPDHADTVTVTLASGDSLSETVGHVPGGPSRPMTAADVKAKFVACGGSATTADLIMAANPDSRIGVTLRAAGPTFNYNGPVDTTTT